MKFPPHVLFEIYKVEVLDEELSASELKRTTKIAQILCNAYKKHNWK